MSYGLAILFVAGVCYVVHLFLMRHYSHNKGSPAFDIEAKTCTLPKKFQFIGALSLLLAIVGIMVLLVGLVGA